MSYGVCKYDYINKSSNMLFFGSERDALSYIESYAYDYILEKQGETFTDKPFNKYVYEHFEEPRLDRYYDASPFYIVKSSPKNNIFKLKVKEKIKKYGWIWNEYKVRNHISLYIFKYCDIIQDENRTREFFSNHKEYRKMLKEMINTEIFNEMFNKYEGNKIKFNKEISSDDEIMSDSSIEELSEKEKQKINDYMKTGEFNEDINNLKELSKKLHNKDQKIDEYYIYEYLQELYEL